MAAMAYKVVVLLLLAMACVMAAGQKPPYTCPAGASADVNNNVLEKFFPISKLDCSSGGDASCKKTYGSQAKCESIGKGGRYCWVSTATVCKKSAAATTTTTTTTAKTYNCPPGMVSDYDNNVLEKFFPISKLSCETGGDAFCKSTFSSQAKCVCAPGKFCPRYCWISSADICPKQAPSGRRLRAGGVAAQ